MSDLKNTYKPLEKQKQENLQVGQWLLEQAQLTEPQLGPAVIYGH